jgi:hypothetical protein
VLVAMLAARTKKITSQRQSDPLMEDGQILARLVCYTSKLVGKYSLVDLKKTQRQCTIEYFCSQAHSCVEKAGLIAMVRVRQLAVDEHFSLRGQTLDESIRADREKGLIPFLVGSYCCRSNIDRCILDLVDRFQAH